MRLDRRAVLLGSAAGFLAVSTLVRAQALPQLPVEATLSNAVTKYVQRMNLAGVAANDNAVRGAVTRRLVAAAPRGLSFLRVFGRFAGAASIVLTVLELAKYLKLDAAVASFFEKSSYTGVSSLQAIADALPRNGYMQGSNGVWYWETWEPGAQATGLYNSAGWTFAFQQNSPEPEPGLKVRIYQHSGAHSVPPGAPTMTYDQVEPLLAASAGATQVPPESLTEVLNKLLASAFSAEPSALPNPAVYPATTADFAGVSPLTFNDLLTQTPLDRDVSLGTITPPSGGGDTGGGGDTASGGSGLPAWPVSLDAPDHIELPSFNVPAFTITQPQQCPSMSGMWKGNEVKMDPCPMTAQVQPLVSVLMPLVYWIGAAKIMFLNGK